MITRTISEAMRARLGDGKAALLMGARQTGKTTLVKEIFNDPAEALYLSGDDADTHALFEQPSASRLRSIFQGKKYVVIDEAQRIKDIGLKIKLLTDQAPEIQVIATGSSSFDLANKVNEPLTGRKWEYRLYPLSFAEMAAHHGLLEEERLIPHYLEEGDGVLSAFEFKWNLRFSTQKKTGVPKHFAAAYPDAVFTVVTLENAGEFLL